LPRPQQKMLGLLRGIGPKIYHPRAATTILTLLTPPA